jgi:hypothetical protein
MLLMSSASLASRIAWQQALRQTHKPGTTARKGDDVGAIINTAFPHRRGWPDAESSGELRDVRMCPCDRHSFPLQSAVLKETSRQLSELFLSDWFSDSNA